MERYGIAVSAHVYVSARFGYFFRVYILGEPVRFYNLAYGFDGWDSAPPSVISEIRRQIYNILKNNMADFYEYDQDGNKRCQNLRYHDEERVQWFIDTYENAQGGGE